jgi:hypothetical protein
VYGSRVSGLSGFLGSRVQAPGFRRSSSIAGFRFLVADNRHGGLVLSSSTGHGSHGLRVRRKLGLGSAENHSASPESCPALLDDAVGPPSTHRNSGFRSWSSPGFGLSLSLSDLPLSRSLTLPLSLSHLISALPNLSCSLPLTLSVLYPDKKKEERRRRNEEGRR